MKTDNCLSIFDYLSEQSRDGKFALSISRELEIPTSDVKEYLNEFSSSFVRVGNTEKYTINRIAGATKTALAKKLEEPTNVAEKSNSVFWLLIIFSIFLSLTTVLITTNGS